jgi:ABC-type lipoprotein release transport system permease subunit
MIPVSYNYRNLVVRWRTTLLAASGFMLVVTAWIVMLAFVHGVESVCAGSGQPENVIVLKKGAFDEVLSEIGDRLARQVELAPGGHHRRWSRADDGRPLSSCELFLAVNRWNEATREYETIQVRGVPPNATRVHSQVHIAEGRVFRRNAREVILGVAVARQRQLAPGQQLLLGRNHWDIVGVFEANGAVFESEVWCDLDQLAAEFHRRNSYTSVVLRCADPEAAAALVRDLNDRRDLRVEAQTEPAYYLQQARQSEMVRRGAVGIAFFMAIGAVFGVANTMFAAIGERIKDIAVLRLLGFGRREILVSFLIEAVLIAVIGAAFGSLLGYTVNGWTLDTALGAGSKSIAFAFQVDTSIVVTAWLFALTMGVLGGLLPAMSTMRVGPLEALR